MNTLLTLGIIVGIYGMMYGMILRLIHTAEEYPEEINSQELLVETC